MNTFKLNIQREIWEFKRSFVWLPAIVVALIVVSFVANAIFTGGYQIGHIFEVLKDIPADANFSQLGRGVQGLLIGLVIPFAILAGFVMLNYTTSTLYEERKDMSVFFWRSLPVADWLTVCSKLIVASLVIPALFLLMFSVLYLIILICGFIGTVVLSVGYDVNIWPIWTSAGIVSSYLYLWVTLIPLTLWFLPIQTYLLMASAAANKAPALMAIIPIAVILILEQAIVGYDAVSSAYFAELLKDYFTISPLELTKQQFEQAPLASLNEVIRSKVSIGGIALSAVFVGVTIWLRKHKSNY